MTTTLEIGTLAGFSTGYTSFLKKEHFVPSVQRDDFASGVDDLETYDAVLYSF